MPPAVRFRPGASARALTTLAPAPDLEAYMREARARTARQAAVLIPDTLSPTPTRLLTLALADHFPPRTAPGSAGGGSTACLPPGHHLVYFPPQLPAGALMADGTDPAHCPGAPFTRRMWAGGAVRFGSQARADFRADGRRAWCREIVGEPALRVGRAPGDEKVFVELTREYRLEEEDERDGASLGVTSPPLIEEKRILVFMREREGRTGRGGGAVQFAALPPRRIVQAPFPPDLAFTLTPSAQLLFHFSALTYNAHAIHYDREYARVTEGYPGLVVHGPLTLVLLLSALRSTYDDSSGSRASGERGWTVRSIDYRNVAPLFAGQQMRVCCRSLGATKPGDLEGRRWSLWIEGPDGGLAVKATAETVRCVDL